MRTPVISRIVCIVLAITGTSPLLSPSDLESVSFSVTVAAPNRVVAQGAVVLLSVEMRNSSPFRVLVSAGHADPPLELHIWNSHGTDVIRTKKAEIADGSAFRESSRGGLIALRFEPGETAKVHLYVPMAVTAGEYQIGVRTVVQPDVSKSDAAVVVDSNRVPLTVCAR